jgi:hypothetical protein
LNKANEVQRKEQQQEYDNISEKNKQQLEQQQLSLSTQAYKLFLKASLQYKLQLVYQAKPNARPQYCLWRA